MDRALRVLVRWGASVGVVSVLLMVAIFGWFGSFSGLYAFLEGRPIAAEEASIDLGEVVAEHPVDACFRLRNVSRAPVRVIGAKASCGCVVTSDLPLKIEAQAENTITFRIRPRKVDVNRDVHIEVVLLFDVDSPPVMLTARAQVRSPKLDPVVMQPNALD